MDLDFNIDEQRTSNKVLLLHVMLAKKYVFGWVFGGIFYTYAKEANKTDRKLWGIPYIRD